MTCKGLEGCVPILSGIFVRWYWLIIIIIPMALSISGLTYSGGKSIQYEKSRIDKNTENIVRNEKSFEKLCFQITVLNSKLDSVLIILKK